MGKANTLKKELKLIKKEKKKAPNAMKTFKKALNTKQTEEFNADIYRIKAVIEAQKEVKSERKVRKAISVLEGLTK